MKLVVGLGNPGNRYRGTRHNVGFMVLAELALRFPREKAKAGFHGDFLDVWSGNEKVLLLCPATYMNRSGLSVAEAAKFYKIEPNDMLIVCDDLNLPFGKLRFRAEGGSGGQKGLADVIRLLGTESVSRLRIGIGGPPGQMNASDYVLMNFTEKERPELAVVLKQAADAVEHWMAHGIQSTMNQYNAKTER